MSAPTVLFVLKRLLERGLPRQGADDCLRPRIHLRRAAARSRLMTPDPLTSRHPRAGHAAAPCSSCGFRIAIPGGCSPRVRVEYRRAIIPFIVAVHALWLAAVVVGAGSPVDCSGWRSSSRSNSAHLGHLASLGPRWTTRIIVLPGAPLVKRGPIALSTTPTISIVVAEIAVVPARVRTLAGCPRLLPVSTPPCSRSVSAKRTTRSLLLAKPHVRAYIAAPLLDIFGCLRLALRGAGPRVFGLLKGRMWRKSPDCSASSEPEVGTLGYRARARRDDRRFVRPDAQVMAERPDTRQLDLTDCERISRRLSEARRSEAATRSRAATASRSARRASTGRSPA